MKQSVSPRVVAVIVVVVALALGYALFKVFAPQTIVLPGNAVKK